MKYHVTPVAGGKLAVTFDHVEANLLATSMDGFKVTREVVYDDHDLVGKDDRWYAFRVEGHPTIKSVHIHADNVEELP